MKLLLSHNAHPNLQNLDGESPLHWASMQQTRLLLMHDANVNLRTIEGTTALIAAIVAYGESDASNVQDVPRLLLDAGADPDLQEVGGNTALMQAIHVIISFTIIIIH